MFHVDNGAGRFSAIYEPDVPGSLCDGQWHKIIANKIKHRLELTVDENQVDGSSLNRASTSAETNDPVFVGGYPGECQVPKDSVLTFKKPKVLKFIRLHALTPVDIAWVRKFKIVSNKSIHTKFPDLIPVYFENRSSAEPNFYVFQL